MNREIGVNENKFSGTATYEVYNAESIEEAKAYARKFWKEEYGHSPSKIVGEEDMIGMEIRHIVMIADHSSGSLKSSKEYDTQGYEFE